MKSEFKHIMLFLLLGELLASCGGGAKKSSGFWEQCDVIAQWNVVNGDSVLSCDLSLAKKKFLLPMSCLFDTLKVVKLESRDDILVGRGYPLISENYIGIREENAPYRLFTRKGEFVCNVGSIGQGPGEYNLIYSSQIDEEYGRIYLLPWPAALSILVYDLQGQFIESIPLAYRVRKGHLYVDSDKQQVTIVNLAFEGTDNTTVAWVQDWQGNIIRENKAPQMLLKPDYCNEVYLHKRNGDEVTFSYSRCFPEQQDTLYTYNIGNNKLTSLYTTNFGEGLIGHNYETCSGYYITGIYGPNDDPSTIMLHTAIIKHRIIVDGRTLRGGYFRFMNDFLGGIHIEKCFIACGYSLYEDTGFSMCMESGMILELIDERLSENISEEARRFLLDWKADISENDNSYVILGKPKEK